MKKLLSLTCLAVLLSFSAFSQNKKNDLHLSAGIGVESITESSANIVGAFSNIFTSIITGQPVPVADHKNVTSKFGAIVLGAKYGLTDKVRIGGDVVFESFSFSSSDVSVLSFIPRVDMQWINKPSFRLYSGLGVGVSFGFDSSEDYDIGSSVAFNVIPAGVEFGKKVCFYAETGIAFNGSVSGGIRFKL